MPEEPPSFGWKQLAVTVIVAVGMAVGLFIVVPLVVVKQFETTFANPFLFNLVEGLIRIAIFILYLVVISLIPDLRKVFEYHGAEHKVIHAYEACGRPDAEFAQGFSTRHPRCGTGFLLLVMVISVFVFAMVGKPSVGWLMLSPTHRDPSDNRYRVRDRYQMGRTLPWCLCPHPPLAGDPIAASYHQGTLHGSTPGRRGRA